MTRSRSRRANRLLVVALAAALTGITSPASALHQYCGKTATAVYLGGYPGPTRDNGHPSDDRESWAGGLPIAEAKRVVFALDRAEGALDIAVQIASIPMDDIASKVVAFVKEIAKAAIMTARLVQEAVLLRLEAAKAEVDACNGAMMGDTIDLLFVAMMEEDLAYFDPHAAEASRWGGEPSPGVRLAPTGTFLLPDDGIPDWTTDGTRYRDYSGHDALDIPYQDGFIDAQSIGVATVVRNAIAHMEAHGIPTANGKALWEEAMELLRQGDVRAAYAKFAEAYQAAVTGHESH